MIEFLSPKPKPFGLAVSDLFFKIAKLTEKGKFLNLSSWGKTEIGKEIIEDGEIKQEDMFCQILKEALKKTKGKDLKTKNVVVSVPEKKAFFTVIQVPKMKEEELKSAISFEAENYIPFPINEVYLDFQIITPLRDSLDHIDVLLAALPKNIVDVYVSCFKKAGLVIQALEVESQSIARAIIKNSISPFSVLIVDFGENVTNFIIFSGKSLRFTSSTPFGSYQLTESISRSLEIDLKSAKLLKEEYGLQLPGQKQSDGKKLGTIGKKIEKKEIFEAMIPALSDLTGQIKKYLNYYQSHADHEHLFVKSKGVQKIILCGKDANLKGFTNFLSLSLKLPVELGNPWINILPAPLKEVPDLSFGESLGYTAALGVALKGIRE